MYSIDQKSVHLYNLWTMFIFHHRLHSSASLQCKFSSLTRISVRTLMLPIFKKTLSQK